MKAKMRESGWKNCLLTLSGIVATTSAAHAAVPTYDLVVYGGTSAGIAAAVQAARMGLNVAIVEPTQHLGGMSSNGLGETDTGNTSAIGGFAADFYRRVGRAYGETVNEYHFEPHIAENTFNSLVSEAGVTVYRGEALPDAGGVTKTGTNVTSITTSSGLQLSGKVFVDASYTGDLMAGSGIASTIGRESNLTYGETYNGVQKSLATKNQIGPNVDPYVTPGVKASGLLPGINPTAPGSNGSADNSVQAFTYRLALTNIASNRQAWTKPANYDASQYTLMSRFITATVAANGGAVPGLTTFLKLNTIKGGKFDLNNENGVSTDFFGTSAYPAGTAAQRVAIESAAKTYELGLLYFLATDASVPKALRDEMNTYGLTKDEFTDNGGVSGQLYIREARRMIGQTVMIDKNILGTATVSDSIALGSYTMDSHNVLRYVNASGFVKNEGDVQVAVPTPYGISYGSIVPQASQASNVIVPVAMSASHIAYGSIRMEPVLMEMGQAAGIAAVNAIRGGTSVQAVNYATLQSQLQTNGAITQWNSNVPAPRFSGTLSEDFNYGTAKNRVDVVSYTTGGWSEPWGPGFDTTTGTVNLGTAAAYAKSANLNYNAPGYTNSSTIGTLVSGGASSGTSTAAGTVVSRGITGGMAGTIWISALVQQDSLSAANEDALIWLDRTAAGNSDNAGNAFIGIQGGGAIALRYAGINTLLETNGATYAANAAHLLLAKIVIDANGTTADSLQFWIDPSLTNLGTANLSIGGQNLFGSSFDGIGLSVGSNGGMIDALRISNLPDGFQQVTALPEPASVALPAFVGVWLTLGQRRHRFATTPAAAAS